MRVKEIVDNLYDIHYQDNNEIAKFVSLRIIADRLTDKQIKDYMIFMELNNLHEDDNLFNFLKNHYNIIYEGITIKFNILDKANEYHSYAEILLKYFHIRKTLVEEKVFIDDKEIKAKEFYKKHKLNLCETINQAITSIAVNSLTEKLNSELIKRKTTKLLDNKIKNEMLDKKSGPTTIQPPTPFLLEHTKFPEIGVSFHFKSEKDSYVLMESFQEFVMSDIKNKNHIGFDYENGSFQIILQLIDSKEKGDLIITRKDEDDDSYVTVLTGFRFTGINYQFFNFSKKGNYFMNHDDSFQAYFEFEDFIYKYKNLEIKLNK